MKIFLKFLFSLIAHAAWRRIGGGGAVPPIRLPRSKRNIPIPVLSSWQLMAAAWFAKKLWQRHGGTVKTRLINAENPVVRRVGSYVPDVEGAVASTNSQAAPAVVHSNVQAAAGSPSPASVTATPAVPSYDTQQLNDDSPSLLSSLRNGAPPTSGA